MQAVTNFVMNTVAQHGSHSKSPSLTVTAHSSCSDQERACLDQGAQSSLQLAFPSAKGLASSTQQISVQSTACVHQTQQRPSVHAAAYTCATPEPEMQQSMQPCQLTQQPIPCLYRPPQYDWGCDATQLCSSAEDSDASDEFVTSMAMLMGKVRPCPRRLGSC